MNQASAKCVIEQVDADCQPQPGRGGGGGEGRARVKGSAAPDVYMFLALGALVRETAEREKRPYVEGDAERLFSRLRLKGHAWFWKEFVEEVEETMGLLFGNEGLRPLLVSYKGGEEEEKVKEVMEVLENCLHRNQRLDDAMARIAREEEEEGGVYDMKGRLEAVCGRLGGSVCCASCE